MEAEKEYASKGVAGTGLGFGIAGTALALLNGGLGGCGGGLLGGCGNGGHCHPHEAMQSATMACLAEKDAEIARLRSEKYTDGKVQELFNFNFAQNEKLNAEIIRNRERFAVIECQLADVRKTVGCITITRIPNGALCPGVPPVEVVHTTPVAA